MIFRTRIPTACILRCTGCFVFLTTLANYRSTNDTSSLPVFLSSSLFESSFIEPKRSPVHAPSTTITNDGADHRTRIHRNKISIENELPGTADWILTKPAFQQQVEGYLSRTSVQGGEKIMLFHNSKAEAIAVEVFRTGWYNGIGARRILGSISVEGISQTKTSQDSRTGRIACNWDHPFVIKTDVDWTTGIYLVRMTEQKENFQSYAIFVLRDDPRHQRRPDILYVLPTNTYQAYNFWGGKSLYRQAVKVSYDRPYACPENEKAAFGCGAGEYLVNIQPIHNYPISSSASWNYNMVRWLERNGVDVSYISNVDVETRLPTLPKPKLFLSQGHDEYWSWKMRDNVEKLRDQGVNLAFLGSNTAYWQIRYEDIVRNDDNVGDEPRTVVCYRRIRRDPDKSKFASVKWRQIRPEAEMVGIEYFFPLGDPYDEDLAVADNTHWIFNNTGLGRGDKLYGLLGYEVDRIRTEWKDGEEKVEVTKLFETPLIDRKGRKIVARGTIYTAPVSGALVFASGTMFWSWALDDYGVTEGLRSSRLNTAVERMTWNLLHAAGIGDAGGGQNGGTLLVDDAMHEANLKPLGTSTSMSNISTTSNEKLMPPDGWMYEPKNVHFFWKKMGDRPFQREIYSRLGKFQRILDVGARGYNRYCKDLINSTTTEYYQMEPNPPVHRSEMQNDGLLEMYMQDVITVRPDLEKSFDVVVDFGVFGWDAVQKVFNDDNDIRKYVDGVRFLLKDDPQGMWALKTDKGWVANEEEFMSKWILPYFDKGPFGGWSSGHNVKGNFRFWWLFKKSSAS